MITYKFSRWLPLIKLIGLMAHSWSICNLLFQGLMSAKSCVHFGLLFKLPKGSGALVQFFLLVRHHFIMMGEFVSPVWVVVLFLAGPPLQKGLELCFRTFRTDLSCKVIEVLEVHIRMLCFSYDCLPSLWLLHSRWERSVSEILNRITE